MILDIYKINKISIMKNLLNREEFKSILEATQPSLAPAQPPAPQAPTQPPAPQAPTQPPAPQAPAEPAAQPEASTAQPEAEVKSGDLSNYNNEAVTKYPDTVKKIVDIIKEFDKKQMIDLRNYVAQQKGLADAKTDIGLL